MIDKSVVNMLDYIGTNIRTYPDPFLNSNGNFNQKFGLFFDRGTQFRDTFLWKSKDTLTTSQTLDGLCVLYLYICSRIVLVPIPWNEGKRN